MATQSHKAINVSKALGLTELSSDPHSVLKERQQPQGWLTVRSRQGHRVLAMGFPLDMKENEGDPVSDKNFYYLREMFCSYPTRAYGHPIRIWIP